MTAHCPPRRTRGRARAPNECCTGARDRYRWLRIEGVVHELYDVVALPRIKRPSMIRFQSEEIRRVVSTGG